MPLVLALILQSRSGGGGQLDMAISGVLDVHVVVAYYSTPQK